MKASDIGYSGQTRHNRNMYAKNVRKRVKREDISSVKVFLQKLQSEICKGLEDLDGQQNFRTDRWDREAAVRESLASSVMEMFLKSGREFFTRVWGVDVGVRDR